MRKYSKPQIGEHDGLWSNYAGCWALRHRIIHHDLGRTDSESAGGVTIEDLFIAVCDMCKEISLKIVESMEA